jgi:starch synthase
MEPVKILFLTAEAAPFAKVGGLGDVGGSLPKALRVMGHDVRVVMPAYSAIEDAAVSGKWNLKLLPDPIPVRTGGGVLPAAVFEGLVPASGVPVYFVAERNLLGRPNIYGYSDDPYRFTFFSLAALELIQALAWFPDVLHAHDWHGAPALTWLATVGQADPRYATIAGVFTIHNLAHQGRSSRLVLNYLGIDEPPLLEEAPGEVNFMARGIFHARMISSVSPTYAREIMTPQGGVGLDGLLRFRHFDVHGILNGIDHEVWNPATDPHLAKNFDAKHPEKRKENKIALQKRLGLPERPEVPLVGMIARLTRQKGLDIVGHPIHLLLNNHAGEAQFVVLGSGEKTHEDMLWHLAGFHQDKMAAVLHYAPDLAPLIYGGADLFLMPSLFEPCGLSQMIAMRYGCIPIVRQTGGLADTVRDGINGFTFYDFTTADLWNCMRKALYLYSHDPEMWQAIQREAMLADFSWQNSARGYQQLYEWAIARRRGY